MYNYVDRTQGICLGQFDICLCLLVQTLYSFICFGYTSDGYGQYQGECIYMSTHTLFRRALGEQNKLLHFNTRSYCMFICTHILMYIYINEQVVFHGNTGNMERAYGKTRFIWFVFFFFDDGCSLPLSLCWSRAAVFILSIALQTMLKSIHRQSCWQWW